jgi:hypothetical protein
MNALAAVVLAALLAGPTSIGACKPEPNPEP